MCILAKIVKWILSLLDINECDTENGGCQQNCTNLVGSFMCSCNDSFSENDDMMSCNGKFINSFFLHSIRSSHFWI